MEEREFLLTAEEMKRAEQVTIEEIGIPSLVLMERAALGILEEIEKLYHDKKEKQKVLILSGCGNNGADGLALARLLSERDYQVTLAVCGDTDSSTKEWKKQKSILINYPIQTRSKNENAEYTILIDALFGVGLSRTVSGEYADWITWFNHQKGFKIAVDVPSGIHSDNGKIMGCAVKADLTVTFAFAKRGLYLYPGAEYAGKILVKDIGIRKQSFAGKVPEMFCLRKPVKELMPKRVPWGNKGTFGKVLLIAGSQNMAGAAILAAKSAYRTGAGMVKVISTEANRLAVHMGVPEALFAPNENLEQSLDWADVLAVGPGIGSTVEAMQMLKQCINKSNLPLVIDADGLNLLASEPELQRQICEQASEGRWILLTPHMGELARLTGQKLLELKENSVKAAQALAENWKCVIVSKDARTCVCKSQNPVCLNITGNSGMATAGSGDVLTGILAGMLAQGMSGLESAWYGVALHGMAGDLAAERVGKHGMMASDVIEALGDLYVNR